MNARRSRRPGRFHRRGMLRPTLAVAPLAVFGALVCYAGLLLDDVTLMAATTAIIVAVALDLALTGLAWLPGMRRPLERWMGVRRHEQWARLDQRGEAIERFAGEVPSRRGWYRCESVAVTWHGPFGLFKARHIEPSEGETLRLPHGDGGGAANALAADQRMAGQTHNENAGGVRDYAAGDPPKLISWRHTARRGQLMTRETSRDIRSVTLLVIDTAGGLDDEGMDRAVALAMPYLGRGHGANAPQPVASDGEGFWEGPDRVRRFLAAVQPRNDMGAGSGERAAQGREEEPAAHPGPAEKARAVAGFVARYHGPLQVMLFTADRAGALARALGQALPGEVLRIVEVPVEGQAARAERGDETSVVDTDARIVSGSDDSVDSHGSVAADGSAAHNRPSGPTRAAILISNLAAHLPELVRAACLLVFFALSVQGLTGLIQPAGAWPWTCGALLALAAVASQIHPRTRMRALLRLLAFALAALVVTAVTVCVRYRQEHGVWLFDLPGPADPACQSIGDGSGYALKWLCDTEPGVVTPSPWTLLDTAFSLGFRALNTQLPPLSVSTDSDILLIVALALAAIVVRCLLLSRRAVPCVAALPVAILAAEYGFVGHKAPWWAIGLLALAFPLSLAFRGRRPRGDSQRNGVQSAKPMAASALASLLAAALTLALTPTAETIAYRVPLSFGEGGGLFSSNTVNPMIDLKRSLAKGSDETVLTYRSDKRVYLRMTTLGDFNGDTWNFDERLARDGGFYGSGIRLGSDAEDELRWWERLNQSTVGLYTAAQAGQSGVSGYLEDEQAGAITASGPFSVLARIDINTLDSRFLPMPDDGSGAIYGSGLNVGSDWVKYNDGTVYNREHGTNDGMSYSVSGNGLEPIANAAGFSQIDTVDGMWQSLVDYEEEYEREMEARRTVRERYAADHPDTARVKDGWLLVDALWHPGDGTLTVDGEIAYEDNRYRTDGSGRRGMTDAFAERFDVGEQETVVFGIAPYYYNAISDPSTGQSVYDGPDIDAKLMLRVEEDAEADDGTSADAGASLGTSDSEQSSASLNAANQRLYQQAVELMPVGWSLGAFGGKENDSYQLEATPTIRYLRPVLEGADQRAEQYLELTDDLPANVRAVIDQARRDGLPAKAKGHDERVAAMRWLVDYFTDPDQGFVYSLDAPDGDGRDNMSMLNRFLDPKRGHKGYCQHYASALAVLGRALGVPTRIVLGYNKGVGGTDGNGEYQVAAKQLHAWTEAYIERVGWVPFDVTPASTDNGSAEADDGGDASSESTMTIGPNDGSGTQTQVRPQGDGSYVTDEEPSDTDAGDGNEDGDAAKTDDGDETATARGSGDAERGWWAGLPIWARIGIGVSCALGCALLAAALAVLWIRRRRRRVLTALSRAAAAPDDLALRGRAWRLAWMELRRSAGRGAGRTGGNLTDLQLAERMAEARPDVAEAARAAARAAAVASFGGTPPPLAEPLVRTLSQAILREHSADARARG